MLNFTSSNFCNLKPGQPPGTLRETLMGRNIKNRPHRGQILVDQMPVETSRALRYGTFPLGTA